MTPDYIITFPMPNNGTVQFHAVDFAEESEHIILEGSDEYLGAEGKHIAFYCNGAVPFTHFTGV